MKKESHIISSGNRKYVTIKIDTDMLVEQFNDQQEPYFKVKNKLGFATQFSKTLAEHIMDEAIDTIIELMADDTSGCIKEIEDDECD